MCSLKDFERLSMCQGHTQCVIGELEDWHRYYLAPIARNTQLDIGAGCGETAFFYLNHGVRRVVCVEGNKECLVNLYKNFGDDKRVMIVPFFVDNIKLDIDGGERGMILETHFPYRLRRLKAYHSHTRLQILEQSWGNPFRKGLRKIGARLA